MRRKKEPDPNILLKTIKSKFSVDNFHSELLDEHLFQTKNVYNSYIFYANIYHKYKYLLIEQYDQKKEFYLYCDDFIKHYLFNLDDMKIINQDITDICKDILENNIVTTKNCLDFYNLILNNIYNYDTKDLITKEIVYRNISNVYYKNFYMLLKEKKMNGKKSNFQFSIANDDLIDDVNNKNHINIFTCSKEDNNVDTSDSTIIKRITREHLNTDTKALHCDTRTIAFDKATSSFGSYWTLKSKGINANKPNYLGKKDKFILSFNSDRNITVNNNILTLRLGLNSNDILTNKDYIIVKKGICINKIYILKNENKRKDKNLNYYFMYNNEQYYIKKDNKNIHNYEFLDIKIIKKLENKIIRQVEIKKNQLVKNNYVICYTYECHKQEINLEEIKPVSIDLGMKYLFSIYDYDKTPTLLDGKHINYINYHYNDLIDKYKSILKKTNNKNTSYHLKCLNKNRSNKLNSCMNNIVSWFMERYDDCNRLIVGYNKNWKTKVNMGKTNNRKYSKSYVN